jgi:hypothetical protein
VTPARPTVVRHHATHKTRHRATHKRHVVVHHKQKPVAVRLTPRAEAYVTSVVDTTGTVVAESGDGGLTRRRRTAGLALAGLCAASFSMLLLGRRGARQQLQ